MMKRVPTQTELPLKRARVQPDDSEVVTLRVRTEVAEAVLKDPAGAVRALEVDAEAFLGYTSWHEEGGPPPCSGYWDLKVRGDFSPTVATHRVWFDKEKDVWHVSGRLGALIPSSVVLADFVWRGLAAPWPMGYTYRVPGLRVMPLE